jgi:hypothetical protein
MSHDAITAMQLEGVKLGAEVCNGNLAQVQASHRSRVLMFLLNVGLPSVKAIGLCPYHNPHLAFLTQGCTGCLAVWLVGYLTTLSVSGDGMTVEFERTWPD